MAPGRITIPLGEWNLDRGPSRGQHLWGVGNLIPEKSGYASILGTWDKGIETTIASANLRGVYQYISGTTEIDIVGTNAKLLSGTSGGALTDCSRTGGGAPPYNTASNTCGWSFTSFGPYCLATNGVDILQIRQMVAMGTAAATATFENIDTTTGIPATSTLAIPAAKYICAQKQCVIIANVTLGTGYGPITAGNHPTLVWWSGLDQGTYFGDDVRAPDIDLTGWQYLFEGDGEITGIIGGYDCGFVFKSGAIFRMDGPPFSFQCISNSIGCNYHNSITRLGDRVYFWSTNGPAYIDARNNEIVLLSQDSMNQSFVDSYFPSSNSHRFTWPVDASTANVSSSCLPANAASVTEYSVQALADPTHRLVVFTFPNALSGAGYNGGTAALVYAEDVNRWSALNIAGAGGSGLAYGSQNAWIVPNRQLNKGKNGPLFYIGFYQEGSSGLDAVYSKWTLSKTKATTKSAQILLPFLPMTDNPGQMTRITAIRPNFINNYEEGAYGVIGAKVNLMTTHDVVGTWPGTVKTYSTPILSADGWIFIPDAPHGVAHAIELLLTPSTAASFSNFETIDVLYEALGYRGK